MRGLENLTHPGALFALKVDGIEFGRLPGDLIRDIVKRQGRPD